MTQRPSSRRGYALLLVMIFVVLFGAMLGVAWRRVASALRIEHACEVRRQCDQGSIQALAMAMQVLETRLTRIGGGIAGIDGVDASTFQYKVQLPGADQWYKIVFRRDDSQGTQWSVGVVVIQPEDALSLPSLPSNAP